MLSGPILIQFGYISSESSSCDYIAIDSSLHTHFTPGSSNSGVNMFGQADGMKLALQYYAVDFDKIMSNIHSLQRYSTILYLVLFSD